CHLPCHRLDHPGVTVTDGRNVIVDVEIPFSLAVRDPDTFRGNGMDGSLVEELVGGTEDLLAPLQQALKLLVKIIGHLRIERIDHQGPNHLKSPLRRRLGTDLPPDSCRCLKDAEGPARRSRYS